MPYGPTASVARPSDVLSDVLSHQMCYHSMIAQTISDDDDVTYVYDDVTYEYDDVSS